MFNCHSIMDSIPNSKFGILYPLNIFKYIYFARNTDAATLSIMNTKSDLLIKQTSNHWKVDQPRYLWDVQPKKVCKSFVITKSCILKSSGHSGLNYSLLKSDDTRWSTTDLYLGLDCRHEARQRRSILWNFRGGGGFVQRSHIIHPHSNRCFGWTTICAVRPLNRKWFLYSIDNLVLQRWYCWANLTACEDMLTWTQQCYVDWPKGKQIPAPLEYCCLKLLPEPSCSEAAIFSPFTPNYHSLSRKSSVAPSVPSATDRDALITSHSRTHMGKDYTTTALPQIQSRSRMPTPHRGWAINTGRSLVWDMFSDVHWNGSISCYRSPTQPDGANAKWGFVWSICDICRARRRSISSSHQNDTRGGRRSVFGWILQVYIKLRTVCSHEISQRGRLGREKSTF